MEAALATRQARAVNRAKRVKTRPWSVLLEEWEDQVRKTHGKQIEQTAWGPAEKVLARKLLREIDLEAAIVAVRYFVTDWCPKSNKIPSFRLFWAVRAQITAEVTGQVTTKRERLDADEPNAEQAKKFPKVGWA